MTTPRIVSEFDVPGNVTTCVLAGRIFGTMNPLVLERSKERLRQRIIVVVQLVCLVVLQLSKPGIDDFFGLVVDLPAILSE